MLTRLTMWIGFLLILMGLLGFVPSVTLPDNSGTPLLLGIFIVGLSHNVIHLVSGVFALAASTSKLFARSYFQIFGMFYVLLTVIGFVQGDTVLGIFSVNNADNFLHLAIATIYLSLGFGYAPSPEKTGPLSMSH